MRSIKPPTLHRGFTTKLLSLKVKSNRNFDYIATYDFVIGWPGRNTNQSTHFTHVM